MTSRTVASVVVTLLIAGFVVATLPDSNDAAAGVASRRRATSMSDPADPSPTPDPTPDPSPTPTETPSPDPTATPTPTVQPSPPTPTAVPPDRPTLSPPPTPAPSPDGRRHDRDPVAQGNWAGWTPALSGSFSTAALDAVAERMRASGASEATIASEVYRPFILIGPATWSDSWHAPRYAGGFHLHEGQDVLCRYGAPVLAASAGTLEFGENSLGGSVAYIRHPDGSFLYYAHLSAFRDGWEGHRVEPGDVIGFCGASGDATVPHVHFGMYDRSGTALNPMASLVDWLHRAERRAGVEALSQPTIGTVPADPTELGILWSAASGVQPVVAPATTAWAPVGGPDTHGVLDGLAAALALVLPVGALVTLRRRRPSGGDPDVRPDP